MTERNNKNAFTLLELLVAMALMNVLAATLYASLYIGFKARRNSNEAIEPVRAAQIAFEQIKKDILSALPATGVLAGEFLGTDGPSDIGGDSLLFYCSSHTPTEEERACDIREVELTLTTDEEFIESDKYVLVRRITTNLLSPRTIEPAEEILCRNVVSLNFRYFDGFEWLDEWDSTANRDALPEAVEVTLEIEKPIDNQEQNPVYQLTSSFTIPCGGMVEDSSRGFNEVR
ncbi:MAG: type II secretion system protein GspJ [Planctomycetota bacterium]